MADSTIAIDEPTAIDKRLDTEALTVGAYTVERERVQIAGATAAAISVVTNTTPGASDYGVVVRLPALPALAAGTNNIGDVDVLTLPALAAGTNNIGDVDVLTVPAPLNLTGGGVEASALRVTLATDSTGVLSVDDNGGSLTVDGTVTANLAAGTNNIGDVDVLTLPGVAGTVAHDGADSGNPVKVGGYATSSERTAVASGDRADFITDLVGKQIVLPFANPENFVSGAQTTSMTGTSDTEVIAAQGAGVRLYITTVVVTNGHATVGTYVNLKDGTTTKASGYAAAAGGGFSVHFNPPLRLTANTAFNAANATTGSDTRVFATGYKGV
jgi:hypothetical protein